MSERSQHLSPRPRASGVAILAPLALLAWVALLAPAVAGAGNEVLGAPSYDHATETTHRTVTWDDFQGKDRRSSGSSRWQAGRFAAIATALRLNKFEIEERQVVGEWRARAAGVRPYAVMNKDFSAAKHGSKSPHVLAHEQLHFDLAEAFARRLAVEMAGFEGRGDLRQDARADLDRQLRRRVEAAMRELGELQDRYDQETNHGTRKKAQKQWAAKVSEMFREATAALEAVLAESG